MKLHCTCQNQNFEAGFYGNIDHETGVINDPLGGAEGQKKGRTDKLCKNNYHCGRPLVSTSYCLKRSQIFWLFCYEYSILYLIIPWKSRLLFFNTFNQGNLFQLCGFSESVWVFMNLSGCDISNLGMQKLEEYRTKPHYSQGGPFQCLLLTSRKKEYPTNY